MTGFGISLSVTFTLKLEAYGKSYCASRPYLGSPDCLNFVLVFLDYLERVFYFDVCAVRQVSRGILLVGEHVTIPKENMMGFKA